jgi:hypothetical protein
MSSENTPPKGVSVGEITDIESRDVPVPNDHGGDDVTDEDPAVPTDASDPNDTDDADRAEIDTLLGGDVAHPEESPEEEGVMFEMPPIADVKEGKLGIQMYKAGCFQCPHLRPKVPK